MNRRGFLGRMASAIIGVGMFGQELAARAPKLASSATYEAMADMQFSHLSIFSGDGTLLATMNLPQDAFTVSEGTARLKTNVTGDAFNSGETVYFRLMDKNGHEAVSGEMNSMHVRTGDTITVTTSFSLPE